MKGRDLVEFDEERLAVGTQELAVALQGLERVALFGSRLLARDVHHGALDQTTWIELTRL